MMPDKIRLLIVEDHSALAENLFEFLGQTRYILDFAADGLTALHLVATNNYDVIVLDVMLPGLSGFELCQRIRGDLHCTTPIIFMTARDRIDDKVKGFTLGGDDYLVKPFHLQELALRVEALHHRRRSAENLLNAGEISFNPGTLKVFIQGQQGLELSGTAAKIFEILIRRYPRFVAYTELQEALWGDKDIEMNNMRTHVYALRKLLQDHFGLSLIKTLHGRGYQLAVPGDA